MLQAGEKWRIPNPPTYIKRNWKNIIPPEANKKAGARHKRPSNGVANFAASAHGHAAVTAATVATGAVSGAGVPDNTVTAGAANGAHRPKQKRDGGPVVNGTGGAASQTYLKHEPAAWNSVIMTLPPVDMSQPPPQARPPSPFLYSLHFLVHHGVLVYLHGLHQKRLRVSKVHNSFQLRLFFLGRITARTTLQALDEPALLKACSAGEGAGGAAALKEKIEAIRARRAWVMEAMVLKRVARMRSSAGMHLPHA